MRLRFWLAAVGVAFAIAMGGCTLGQATISAPVVKEPSANYQLQVMQGALPKNVEAICYNDADIAVVRARMMQQEFSVATLQCQTPEGHRALEQLYSDFVVKFAAQLPVNGRDLQKVAIRKHLNVDTLVTDFANRTAQRAPVDPSQNTFADSQYCARNKRALEWALDPKVKKLSDVPPPYDLGPEMSIFACSSGDILPRR